MNTAPSSVAASVRARLLNVAKAQGVGTASPVWHMPHPTTAAPPLASPSP